MVMDGLLALIWALARCYLAVALWTKALDPALLGGRRSLWRLTPLAVVWLITAQCIAGLGSLMPLAAELWAGEPWLEAIYPHGQLIWTALSLAGWLPALLAGMLWYKLRGGRIPGRRWAATVLGAVVWALLLWGLRVAADALGHIRCVLYGAHTGCAVAGRPGPAAGGSGRQPGAAFAGGNARPMVRSAFAAVGAGCVVFHPIWLCAADAGGSGRLRLGSRLGYAAAGYSG